MKTGTIKNIQKNNHYLIVLLILLLLVLGSGQELLHNHKADSEHHHDCPAYHLFLLFSSILIFNFIFFVTIQRFSSLKFIRYEAICIYIYKYYHPRAPPF